jgi:hypothetical protein
VSPAARGVWVAGPSVRPAGTKSQALPSACTTKASAPDEASAARASGGRRCHGDLLFGKSGISWPDHSPARRPHQTRALRSLQGRPFGSADARLYRIRLLAGQPQPHSLATDSARGPGVEVVAALLLVESGEHRVEILCRGSPR